MSDVPALTDDGDRLLAETTWDRNVVVIAGAGTGKTTILVNRILNLLMREPDPLAITEIVALTFTNKAAMEMKQRLRRELGKLAERADEPASSLFCTRYQISQAQLSGRASAALDQLEKSQIGTLHSFAAHLLRLHPLEAGIDQSFQEDDGSRFKELFDARWRIWLAEELDETGRQHARWRRVLGETTLTELRELAVTLSGESLDLQELERQCHATEPLGAFREWLGTLLRKAVVLQEARAKGKQRKAEEMLGAAVRAFQLLQEQGTSALARLTPEDRSLLEKDFGNPTSGWDESAFAEAKTLVAVAQQMLSVNQLFFQDVIALLRPFLHAMQHSFCSSGWISFDGLLARAKTLLRDHPAVRTRIKQAYRAILVDEFQDTDPVQYEIILYLGERPGHFKTSWEEVELEPGKLFIVGDPKQSIYAFRRADIEAFDRVMHKILASGGVAYSLVTNFRSEGTVLAVVNGLFDRLFKPETHVQPPNERLTARPQRQPEVSAHGVQLRLVTSESNDDEFDAADATRAEAATLARWLKEELLVGAMVVDRDRRATPLQPGHVALIFRKLTQAQEYLDALRLHGIAYLTDGEKHFYRRQEIIELVNLLRVIDNPHDHIAIVGVLRSSLGGIADHDLVALRRLDCFDYNKSNVRTIWPHPDAERLAVFYERLSSLRGQALVSPVPEVIDLVFDRLPLLELAASSRHGEQAVANLLKARDIAEELADRPHLTLTGFIDLMMERLDEQPDEAESALAEASLDAVRVLTIHKAKGLEFPVVVLPGLHQGARTPRKGPTLHHDWSSRCYGLTVGAQRNLGSLLVDRKMAAREEAEQRRLLYVGMTRARDLLVLSGGRTRKTGRDTVLSLLQEAVGEEGPPEASSTINIADGQITRVIVPASARERHRPPLNTSTFVPPAIGPILKRLQTRAMSWAEHRSTARRTTPSLILKDEPHIRTQASRQQEGAETAALVGICAHAILERWEFSSTFPISRDVVDASCRAILDGRDQEQIRVIQEDLLAMMQAFMASDSYKQLQTATILGREVPFVIPWGHGQIMEGVIDLLYRLDGKIWIADYKTDRVTAAETPARVERYGRQAALYRQAVADCLGTSSIAFHFLFLRPAVSIAI